MDKRPVLTALDACSSNTEIGLVIINHGWGDARNIVLTFEAPNMDFGKCILDGKEKINVDLIEMGTEKYVPLWNSEDFLVEGEYYLTINCADDLGDIEISVPKNEGKTLCFGIQDGIFYPIGGQGAASTVIYGIEIDTSQESYVREEAISESISPHDRLELPICFTANKSCDLDFRVGFEILKKNNKKIVIWSKFANLKFKKSSFYRSNGDVGNYSKEDLESLVNTNPGEVAVTYPYIDKEILKYV